MGCGGAGPLLRPKRGGLLSAPGHAGFRPCGSTGAGRRTRLNTGEQHMRYVVGAVADLPPGSSTIVYPDKVKSGVGVFNLDGQFFALKNTCPHMGGPLCQGRVRGTTEASVTESDRFEMQWVRDGEVIACPWHHWEFDIRTGRTIFPSRQRVRSYKVSVEPPEMLARLEAGAETVPVSIEEAAVVIDV